MLQEVLEEIGCTARIFYNEMAIPTGMKDLLAKTVELSEHGQQKVNEFPEEVPQEQEYLVLSSS